MSHHAPGPASGLASDHASGHAAAHAAGDTNVGERPEGLGDALPRVARSAPAPVRTVQVLEGDTKLDGVSAVLRAVSAPLGREPLRSSLLGAKLGHALHPLMTDLPIGLWTSAVVVDLFRPRSGARTAQFLVGAGTLAVVPTALTGLAEWRETSEPETRLGSAHAVLNAVGGTAMAASWWYRRSGRHATGVLLSLVGAGVVGASGFLGGHLSTVRKVGSRHTAFTDDGVGPELSRPAVAAAL
ncbi:MAG TPA: DUF2231 domain-containing protein [Dermatophilaceae bacterium]|nr:DUF2231 domain-containing protein [Dermatophilaceae bacterium]